MGGRGKIRLSGGRRVEAVCLLFATATIGSGLALVFSGKARSLPALSRDLAEGHVVHLGQVKSPSQLQPVLSTIDPLDRPFVASRIFDYVNLVMEPSRTPGLGGSSSCERTRTVPGACSSSGS